jgi:hypothetical protein
MPTTTPGHEFLALVPVGVPLDTVLRFALDIVY